MTAKILEAEVDSLSHDGRGVARIDGKVFFVEDALPGELVRFMQGRRRRSYETGRTIEVLRPSADRVDPPCEYFGTCGGCALQHLGSSAQIAAKQQQLADNLARIAKAAPDTWLSPLTGPEWHYRRKARLGCRLVPKKGGVLIGFRERGKSYITSLRECLVLDKRISELMPGLHRLVGALSCPDRVPQIEVAAGDTVVSLVFRHLAPLTDLDLEALTLFAQEHDVQVYLQAEGLDSIRVLYPESPLPLTYALPAYGIRLEFGPADFVQVNAGINGRLVDLAIDCLQPSGSETILDLFCGLGNFTLPVARRAGAVYGVEGDPTLVARGTDNARRNAVTNANFEAADLYQEAPGGAWSRRRYDKVLLDPPRTGAMEAVKRMDELSPGRLVYISCNPATLARDAEVLIHKQGYTLRQAGVVDMFPHTNHVESIAVFER